VFFVGNPFLFFRVPDMMAGLQVLMVMGRKLVLMVMGRNRRMLLLMERNIRRLSM